MECEIYKDLFQCDVMHISYTKLYTVSVSIQMSDSILRFLYILFRLSKDFLQDFLMATVHTHIVVVLVLVTPTCLFLLTSFP